MDVLDAKQTDIVVSNRYRDIPMNGNIELFNGLLELKLGTNTIIEDGTISLDLSEQPSVRFGMEFISTFATYPNEGELSIPSLPTFAPAPLMVLKRSFEFSSGKAILSGRLVREGFVVRKLKADGNQEPVGRIKFHLVNFSEYYGSALWDSVEDKSREWMGRVTFTFGKWTVTLDQFPDVKQRLDEAKAVHGYVLTHVGVLQRSDNKLFSPDEVEATLEMLYWFLSFIAGRRIAYVLPTGLRHLGYPLWQRWNTNLASPVRSQHNWFSKLATQQCFAAAEPFHACWSDANKREWLRSALGLYFACSYNHEGLTNLQNLR